MTKENKTGKVSNVKGNYKTKGLAIFLSGLILGGVAHNQTIKLINGIVEDAKYSAAVATINSEIAEYEIDVAKAALNGIDVTGLDQFGYINTNEDIQTGYAEIAIVEKDLIIAEYELDMIEQQYIKTK